ncbi:heme-binding protein [Sphingomonas colocasiae]|uniref:Heme-binding protein n=2 Tax=Sphingomonas colocasiae TaxID=1848973 RepID=A0ABS7PUL9_9SPHN|nr:heme-binding protein [Sphingomonas colocasiae]
MTCADPRGRWLAALALLFLGAGSAGAESAARTDAALRLDEARRIAGALVDLATEKGRSVSVVVVNREGRIILSQRMDDASFVSLQLAEGKAITAAAVGVPTRLLEQQVDGGKASVLSAPGVIAIAGGVPVARNGKVVAAIGVSGAASDEDDMMATAARDAVIR